MMAPWCRTRVVGVCLCLCLCLLAARGSPFEGRLSDGSRLRVHGSIHTRPTHSATIINHQSDWLPIMSSRTTRDSTRDSTRASDALQQQQQESVARPRTRSSSRARVDRSRSRSRSGKKHRRTASPAGSVRRSSRRSLAAEAETAAVASDEIANGVQKKARNNNLRSDSSDRNGPALDRFRRAAELGKLQLGFHNDQYIEDISVEFLYKPHTVTALLLIVAVLLFLAFRADPSPDDWVSNARVGVAAASFFVLVLGMLIFPSGPFIRPHPVVWRLAFGVAVLYEIWLILLLFQTKEHARLSMKFFDQSLGVPVTERSYAADCSFNWKTVTGAMDIFVVSHFVGWIVKALIIRDMLICWVISIQWELIEILFQHMLPNFAECWWDQWVLDVLLSNALGIYLGCKLAKYLEMKEYRWGSYSSIPSYLGKAKRTLMQFTPASWTKVEWKSTSSFKRIVAVQILIVAMHLEELNAFFLKFILWVPPESKLNLVRLIIWAFVGVPSLRQIYSYLSDPNCKRIGHQTFLCVVVLLTELIVICKFGKDEFPSPMPANIKAGFTTFMAGYVLILIFLMMRTRTTAAELDEHEQQQDKSVAVTE